MWYCKKLICIALVLNFIITSLCFSAFAASPPVAVDFDVVVDSGGKLSLKGLVNTTSESNIETNPNKHYTLGEADIIFNNNAAFSESGTQVAVPSWNEKFGPTIKLGPYSNSYWIIQRYLPTMNVVKLSTAFKKLDTSHNLSVYQIGGSGVEFNVSGNKIKLGGKDTGLTWTPGHWYQVELYFHRTSAEAGDGLIVMYLTDLDAEGGPVVYRRETFDSWSGESVEFRPATGRSWSSVGTDIEWAYWYVDDAAGEVFISTNSFDANYIEGNYYSTEGFASNGSWTLSEAGTGYFKLPKNFPTSGEVTLDIYDKGNTGRTIAFNAYDEEVSAWGTPQELIKMNNDKTISVAQLAIGEDGWIKDFVEIPSATWESAKEYKTSLKIDLDSVEVYSIDGVDTSFYPTTVTLTDVESGAIFSVDADIPLDVESVDGISVTTVKSGEIYDFTSLGEDGIQGLIESEKITIKNPNSGSWSIDGNGLKLVAAANNNIDEDSYVNLFQFGDSGDYTAIAKVDANAETTTSSSSWKVHTGLTIHADKDNYLIFGIGSQKGGYIVSRSKINGELKNTTTDYLDMIRIGDKATDQGDIWLKIEKTGDVYNCYYSLDGTTYIPAIQNYTFDNTSAKLGIYSGSSATTNTIEGIFKSLTIKEPGEEDGNYSIQRIVMNHSADTHMVVASKPFNTKRNVQIDVIPEITFDIAPYDLNDYIFSLSYEDETDNIPVNVSSELKGNTVKLVPDNDLKPGKVYNITVEKGNVTIYKSQFTTIADAIVYQQMEETEGNNLTTRQFVKTTTLSQPIMLAGAYATDGILLNRDAYKPEVTAYADLTTTLDIEGSVTTDVLTIEDAESLRPLVVTPKPTTITSAVLKDAYFDRSVPGRLCVKGKLIGAPENTEVFVLVIPDDGNDGTTAAQERELILTNDGISNATYYKKLLTNAAGEFEFSAQTSAEAGDYKIAFGYNGCDSAIESPIVKNFEQSSIDTAISAVNMATTNAEMFTALETYRDVLDIGVCLDELDAFDGVDDNIIHQDMSSRLSKYVVDNRPVDGYTQVITVTNNVKKIVPLCEFDYAHSNDDVVSKKALLNDSDDRIEFGISALEALEVFDSLSDVGKTRVAEKLTANDNNDFELFKRQFIEETLLSAIQNAFLHSDLTSAFKKCYNSMESSLTGINYATYSSLDDKSSVNIGIVGSNFVSISDLAEVMNPLIRRASSSTSPSGGSGGSGGSFKPVIEKPTVTEPSYVFNDMKNYDWAQEAVNELAKQKIISGKAEGVFDPGGNVLREEFTKMIVLLFNLSGSKNLDFADVSNGDWFYEYIDAAFSNGIVNGISEQRFGVGDKILRQDMAVMIYRAAVKVGVIEDGSDVVNMFSDDSEIDEYAKQAVYALAKIGVINGTGNGMFNPKGTATRAEAAKIIYEILKFKSV